MIKRRTFAFLGIAFLLFAGLAPAFSSCGLAEFLSFPDKFPYYTEDLDSYLDDMEKYGEGEISFPEAMIPLQIPENAELLSFSYYNYYREKEDAYLEIRFSSVEELRAYLSEYVANAENYLRQYTPPTTGEWFLTVPNPYHSAYTDLVSCHATVHSGGETYTGYYVEPLGEEGLPWLLANCWIVSFSEEELCVIHSRFRGSFFENEDRYTPKYLRRFQVEVEPSLDRRYFLSGEALDSEE